METDYSALIAKVSAFQEKGLNTIPFTYKDVLNKFGQTPRCYLSGKEIDWHDKYSYQLDHVIAKAEGGLSNLDNLDLLSPICNQIKFVWDIPLLMKVIRSIVKYQDDNPELVLEILERANGHQIHYEKMWEVDRKKKIKLIKEID